MDPRLSCGRTAPSDDPRAIFRDQVETLHVKKRGVRLLFRSAYGGRSGTGEDFLCTLQCPLPPVLLPDGTSPYHEIEPHHRFGGSTDVSDLDPDRLQRLWSACLADRPERCGFTARFGATEHFRALTILLDFRSEASGYRESELELVLWPVETSMETSVAWIESFLLTCDWTVPSRPRAIRRPDRVFANSSNRYFLGPVAPDLDLPSRLVRTLRQLGAGQGPPTLAEFEFSVRHPEPGYARLRETLNRISRSWTTQIRTMYRPDFDPFRPPGAGGTPDGVYRYPVAHRLTGIGYPDEPRLQIDVVHAAGGSFLEFSSVDGKKPLRQYAALAGVDLVEYWGGAPGDRW